VFRELFLKLILIGNKIVDEMQVRDSSMFQITLLISV